MIDLATILILLSLLFGVFLLLHAYTSLKTCAICGAVASTWIILLVLYFIGTTVDPIVIGILMGGSIVGSMYLLEEKLHPRYQLFKLPFLVSLVSLAYWVLGGVVTDVLLVLFVSGLWVFFLILYFLRGREGVRESVRHIIECCKNW